MNLQQYMWSRNPRGLHNSGPFRPFTVERYTRPQMGWAKLVAGGDEYVEEAARLVELNCTPIVRIYRTDMGAMAPSGDWYDIYQAYISVGCRWFELYNEPNRDNEWPQAPEGGPVVKVTWENTEECIRPLMDHWIEWAERVIDLGGYPAFPALAESSLQERSTVYWMNAFLQYLKDAHHDRFMRVIGSGLWCATHPYLLNHFYQEPPGGPPHVARPYYQQSADEPGWHFEYPYDPLQQAHDPGRTVFGATPQVPYGDPCGLIAAGEAFQQLLSHHFAAGPVPVVGTEGGIVPIPHLGEAPHQPDTLYPPYSYESYAEAIMAMWRWIAEEGPPWFFGLTLYEEADFYEAQGPVLAIEQMAARAPRLKEVPSIETGGVVAPLPLVELVHPSQAVPSELISSESEPAEGTEAALPPAEPSETGGAEKEWLEALDLSKPPLAISDDWLAGVGAEPGPETPAASEISVEAEKPAEAGQAELPDWLFEEAGLAAADMLAGPEEAVEVTPPEPPMWPEQVDLHAEAEQMTDREESPLAEIPVADEAAPAVETGLPAWILEEAGLGVPLPTEAVGPQPAEAVEETPREAELPEWLIEAGQGAVQPEAAVEPAPEEAVEEVGLPDWLVEAGVSVTAPEGVSEPESAAAAEELPAWLIEELEAAAAEPAPEAEVPVQEPVLPAWLEKADLGAALPAPAATPALPMGVEDMAGLEEPLPPELPEEPAVAVAPSVIELPAWLEKADLVAATPTAEGGLPTWLEKADLVSAQATDTSLERAGWAEEVEPAQGLIEPPPPEMPEELAEPAAGPVPETPSWLMEPVPVAVEAVAPAEAAPPESVAATEPVPAAAVPPAGAFPQPSTAPARHWVFIAPDLNLSWVLDAGWRYWQTFRPTLMSGWDLFSVLPPDQELDVTVIVTPDKAGEVEARIREAHSKAQVDVVVVDTLDDLAAELNWRVAKGRRLG